jgi:hypothetical protein
MGGTIRLLNRATNGVRLQLLAAAASRFARCQEATQDKEWHVKRDNAQEVASREGTPRLSRTEAVWQAVEALGYRADVTEILEYVREHFGIDASTPPASYVVVEPPAAPPRAEAPAPPVHKPASQPRPRPRNRTSSE